MRRGTVAAMLLAALVIVAGSSSFAGPHRLGVGARYNVSVGNLTGDFEKDGLSWILSYQYAPVILVKIEADLEMLPDSLTGLSETMWHPQVHLLLGSGLYGGIGIGMPYYDGDFADDPVYNLRAGLDLELIPGTFHIDLNANYAFTEFDQISDVDADYITLAVIGRLEF